MNAGLHWVDFALAALGDDSVQSVFAACDVSTRTFRDGIEVETEAITYAVTRSGVRLVMQTGDEVRPAREGKQVVYRLYGSLGSIEFWGWEDNYWWRAGRGGRTLAPPTVTPPLNTTAH
jgi:predicted dehydrogenase